MSAAAFQKAADLRAQERWAESAAVLAPLVDAEPGNFRAAYYFAMALLETGRAGEAEPHFRGMVSAGKHVAEASFMLGRCHMEQNDPAAARGAFETAHRLKPTALTLRALSNLDWMEGRVDAFRARLSETEGPLRIFAYGLWVESEDLAGAERAWSGLDMALRASPEALVLRAQHLRQAGDGPGSLACARAAQSKLPDDAGVIDALAVGHLMCGQGLAALEAIAPLRRAQPHNQHWIAHEATALRMMGDDRAGALLDMDGLVRAYDLPVPEGFETLSAFNAAMLGELDGHHTFANHPLNQSLRAGSQTAEDLLVMQTPAVKAYIRALSGPINQYLADVGTGAGHPLKERNNGRFRIRGCWSVRLHSGGRHVNHVHPEGWISSAYYVCVPEGGEGRAGWIKFGEPPFATHPPMEPLKWVQPEAGKLVLFPSYLWHGTEPIGQGAVRVTAPFDVVPA